MKEFFIVSYSYTGHTHQIAQAIHTLTGGDWCEILGTDLPGILRDWLNQNGLQSLSDAYTGDQYKETVEKGEKSIMCMNDQEQFSLQRAGVRREQNEVHKTGRI